MEPHWYYDDLLKFKLKLILKIILNKLFRFSFEVILLELKYTIIITKLFNEF